MTNIGFDQSIYDNIAASTNLISGDDYKKLVFNISKFASDMVVKTLGPYGATTIIDDSTFTYPSKDGWTCLNKLHFNDPIYDTIFKVLKQISFSIVTKVGDGTTSALIGANAFLEEILNYQKDHEFRQVDFLNELDIVRDRIIKEFLEAPDLNQIDKEGDFSDIRRIAYISSNSNDKLSDIIQEIYKETANPNIYVTIDPGTELTYDVLTGYQFECSVLNFKAYINEDNGTCKMENKNVLFAFFNHNITYNEHAELVSAISRYAQASNSTVIIAAPYFDDIITNVIGTSINQMLQAGQVPNIIMMQVPLVKDVQSKFMSDLVMLTNAQVFDIGKVKAFYAMIHNENDPEHEVEKELLKTPDYHFESPTDLLEACFGKINSIVIDKNYAIISDYDSIANQTIYKNTKAEAYNEYMTLKEKVNKSDTPLNREYMDAMQRYVKLMGKMGTIKVGGASELEKHCIKDSVDDAVLACRSAYDNGYIRGLNLSTLSVIDHLIKITDEGIDLDILQMLKRVFITMTDSVMLNKYDNETTRSIKLATHDTVYNNQYTVLNNLQIIDLCLSQGLGYNLVTEEFEDLDNLTVINSVSTDIEILKAIIGTLSLMLTSNQFLSTNRVFNKTLTHDQLLDQQIADKKKTAIAVYSELFDSFLDKADSRNMLSNK